MAMKGFSIYTRTPSPMGIRARLQNDNSSSGRFKAKASLAQTDKKLKLRDLHGNTPFLNRGNTNNQLKKKQLFNELNIGAIQKIDFSKPKEEAEQDLGTVNFPVLTDNEIETRLVVNMFKSAFEAAQRQENNSKACNEMRPPTPPAPVYVPPPAFFDMFDDDLAPIEVIATPPTIDWEDECNEMRPPTPPTPVAVAPPAIFDMFDDNLAPIAVIAEPPTIDWEDDF